MNASSMFKVLVLGGALLTAHATSAQSRVAKFSLPIQLENEGALAFCEPKSPDFCELNGDGKSVPKPGLVCCWGTSCE